MYKQLILIITLTFLFVSAKWSISQDYFVATTGEDSASGSESFPFRTITHANSVASPGDVVYIRGGEYGEIAINSVPASRSGYIKFDKYQGELPIISKITISADSITDFYIELSGILVSGVINISNANNVKITNLEVRPDRWSTNSSTFVTAFSISTCENILLDRVFINGAGRGVQPGNTVNLTISNSQIAVKGGSGIQVLGQLTSNLNIIGNHIYEMPYTPYPDNPLAYDSPHQSAISIRTDSVSILNNVIHDIGSSAGIMTYEPDAAGGEASYDNIRIENNVIVNTKNVALRFYNVGSISLINNLLYNRPRFSYCEDGLSPDARYRYETAVSTMNVVAGGFITAYNNIFLGLTELGENAVAENNLIWYGNISLSEKNTVYTSTYMGCGKSPKIFEDGTVFTYIGLPPQDIINWKLAKNSPAINAGNFLFQYPKAIGEIGDDGFLIHNGRDRSSSVHSIGPFEPRGARLFRNVRIGEVEP